MSATAEKITKNPSPAPAKEGNIPFFPKARSTEQKTANTTEKKPFFNAPKRIALTPAEPEKKKIEPAIARTAAQPVAAPVSTEPVINADHPAAPVVKPAVERPVEASFPQVVPAAKPEVAAKEQQATAPVTEAKGNVAAQPPVADSRVDQNDTVPVPAGSSVEPATPSVADNGKKPAQHGTKEKTKHAAGKDKAPVAEKDSKKEAGKEDAAVDTKDTTSYLQSLQKQSPTKFIRNIQHADKDTATVQQGEKTGLQKNLPVIDQPTGLHVVNKGGGNNAVVPDASKGPDLKTQGGGKKAHIDIRNNTPTAKTQVKTAPLTSAKAGNDKATINKALGSAIASLPTSDNTVDTSLGPKPVVDLSGEADPGQTDKQSTEADATMQQSAAGADQLTHADFGETNIYPDIKPQKLTPRTKLSPVPPAQGTGPVVVPQVSPELSAAFDEGATAKIQAAMDEEMAKNDAAKNKMQEDQEKEHNEHMQHIDDETKATRVQQQEAQNSAKAKVEEHRTDWRKENEKIKQDYADKSQSKKDEIDKNISDKTSEADRQIEGKYAETESKIQEQKEKTDAEAAAKKKEAEEKESSGGFWSAVGDFLGDVWDGIKNAVNFIFDKLKQFVKAVIDTLKAAVNAIIDAVRDAVVGLIKVFGEVLKALVNVALAAFPELAKKINALIDKAVDAAVDVVNKLAEGLKKVVDALLDALGAVLDFILSAYQAIYNAIIDALKFLTVGLIKIIEGLANLGEAAAMSPLYTIGALSEEALGSDVTSPLPNIERDDNEIAAFAAKYGPADETGVVTSSADINGLDSKQRLSDDDVVTETPCPVQLEPELIAQARMQMGGKDTLELGGAGGDAVTTSALRDEVFGQPVANVQAPGTSAGPAAGKTEPDWLHMSDDAKLDYHIEQMGKKPPEDINPKEPKAKPENDPGIPIEMKTGKLSIPKRLAFAGRQMIAGMKMFWEQHKVAIIASLVGAFVVGGVVAFFTGGAGLLVLLEVLMDIMALYFAVDAIANASGAVLDYLKQGWAGQIVKAAKSLAKSIAIVIVNFLLDYVLEGVGEVLKSIKNAIKGTKAFEKVSKIASNIGERATKLLSKAGESRFGGAIVKNGKYVLTSIEKGVGKGIKKLEELREKILRKFGFKRIWLEKHGLRIELWAEFNAKILLWRMDEEEEVKDLRVVEDKVAEDILKNAKKEKPIVGHEFEAGKGERGVLLDLEGNEFTESYKEMNDAQRKAMRERLQKMTDDERRKLITGGAKSERVSLRQDIEYEVWRRAKYENGHFINPKPEQPIPHLEPPQFFEAGHPHAGKRKPRADIGHKQGESWKKRLAEHKEKGHTREQILDTENNADLYEIQDRSVNRSNKHTN